MQALQHIFHLGRSQNVHFGYVRNILVRQIHFNDKKVFVLIEMIRKKSVYPTQLIYTGFAVFYLSPLITKECIDLITSFHKQK